MRFEKEIEILQPKEKVWQFLWDIDRFITCVPGCKEAKTVEAGKHYTAVMVEKVGPFRVQFPMRIEVIQSEEGTLFSFVALVDILGKLAVLGHSIIKRKADQAMEEFAQAVKKRLEED